MTLPTLQQVIGQVPNINDDVLELDLALTPFDLNAPLSGIGLLSYMLKNAQAAQSNEPTALFTVGEASPLVVARGGAQKSRYRFTVDFYADPPQLDPASFVEPIE